MNYPSISNQARNRGHAPTELVGKTARELRDLGYLVPPQVDDAAVLDQSEPGEPVIPAPESVRAVVLGSSVLVWRSWAAKQPAQEG